MRACTYPTIGHGTGKYLGIKDPGALSKTIIKPDDTASYLVYFNLWNPNTSYNEAVDGDGYYIDIQIIEKDKQWLQDGSTSIFHDKFLAKELTQETDATPIVPKDSNGNPVFADNDATVYPFFYEIPNIDHLPAVENKSYSLYITTIWINHPGTHVDEPIDQVKRSFAPFAYLHLDDITLPASQSTISTFGNYVWNIGSTFSITVQISLSISDPKLSISPSTLTFTLGPGQKAFFQLDF